MFWFVELKLNSPGTFTGTNIASHAHVLRGSSRVPARRTSADLSEKKKKRRPITADFQIWEVHFGP